MSESSSETVGADAATGRGRLPLVFILLTVMIDAMGIGLIIPVMPNLIREVGGGTLSDAAIWGGILTTTFAVMQFLFGPTLGNLSDRVGRRPVLLVSLGFLALDYLIMAVAGSIWLLLAGRILGGITAATTPVASAYIADISRPDEKAARFGLVGAAFGLGFVIGPLMGGLLAEFGTRAPFYAAAVLAALNMVFGLVVLPETLKPENRRPFQWRRANPLGAFAAVTRLPEVRRPLLIFFVYSVAFWVYPSVWAFYTQARFGWDPAMVGVSLAGFGIAMALVQGGLIRVILRMFGDRGTVLYGLVFNVFIFAALASVTNGTIALIIIPISALGAVVTPALQGIMSRAVADNAQGELQGVIASVNAVSMIFSPLLMTQVFAAFTAPGGPIWFPGAPFLLSMGLMLVCLVIHFARPRTVVCERGI
jgi:MFS transporter, DHA1 family, tetracycline resistance protein